MLFRASKVPVEPMLQFYRFEGQGHELLERMTDIRKPARNAQPMYPGWPPPNVDIIYRGSKGVGVMHFTGTDVELIGTVDDIYYSEYVVALDLARWKKIACGVASEIILGALFQLAPLRSVPKLIQRGLQVGIPAVGDHYDPEFSKLPGMAEGDRVVEISAHPAAGPERVMRAHGMYWYRRGKLISGGQVLFDTALFAWTE